MRRLKIAVCLIFVASCVIYCEVQDVVRPYTAGDHMQG